MDGDEVKRSTDDENLLASFWPAEVFEVAEIAILARFCALLELVRGERGDNGPDECSLDEDGKRRLKLHFLLGVRGAGATAAVGAGGMMGATCLAAVAVDCLWGDDISIIGTVIVRSRSSCVGVDGKVCIGV